MASVIPREYKNEIVTALKNETWKVALLDPTFVYVSGTDVLFTDANIQAHEVVGTGYTEDGATILPAAKTVAYDGTGLNAYLDTADVQWTSATFTAKFAVVYETTGKKIRAIYDFLASKSVTGGTFTLQWHPSGLIVVTS